MSGATIGRWSDLLTGRHAVPLATLCLGVGLYALNAFLVSTALPTAVIEIGGVALLSWASTVFLVMAIVGGATGALLKQRVGARAALIAPAILFLAGTVLASTAESMAVVLAGRALQGLGEGVIAALCYALVPELFPPRLVPKVFGIEALVWAVAAFGGPLLSGVLTETVSWRAAFLVNVPLILLFVALVAAVVPRGLVEPAEGRFPALRLLGCAAGIMLVAVAGIVETGIEAALLVLAALATLVGVFLVDRRSRQRLFPGDAFALTTPVGLGLWVVVLMPLASAASTVYLVITVQQLWGYGPTVAGYFSAVAALAWSGSALVVANLERSASVRMIRLGPKLLAAGLAALALAVDRHELWAVIGAEILIGAGFGVSWAYLSQMVMTSAREGERDRASAMVPTVQSGGFALGAAVAGLVANAAGFSETLQPDDITRAVTWTFAIAAAIAALAWLATLRLTPEEGAAEREWSL